MYRKLFLFRFLSFLFNFFNFFIGGSSPVTPETEYHIHPKLLVLL